MGLREVGSDGKEAKVGRKVRAPIVHGALTAAACGMHGGGSARPIPTPVPRQRPCLFARAVHVTNATRSDSIHSRYAVSAGAGAIPGSGGDGRCARIRRGG
jgi:hypothetical protein